MQNQDTFLLWWPHWIQTSEKRNSKINEKQKHLIIGFSIEFASFRPNVDAEFDFEVGIFLSCIKTGFRVRFRCGALPKFAFLKAM